VPRAASDAFDQPTASVEQDQSKYFVLKRCELRQQGRLDEIRAIRLLSTRPGGLLDPDRHPRAYSNPRVE
jgi:hypothetical protein